jgi:hypothetical protein
VENVVSDGYDDGFVPVWVGPYAGAQERLQWLESSHIPVDLDDASSVGEARVVVPREYVGDAQAVLRDGPRSNLALPLIDTNSPVWYRWRYLLALLVLIAIVATLVL